MIQDFNIQSVPAVQLDYTTTEGVYLVTIYKLYKSANIKLSFLNSKHTKKKQTNKEKKMLA